MITRNYVSNRSFAVIIKTSCKYDKHSIIYHKSTDYSTRISCIIVNRQRTIAIFGLFDGRESTARRRRNLQLIRFFCQFNSLQSILVLQALKYQHGAYISVYSQCLKQVRPSLCRNTKMSEIQNGKQELYVIDISGLSKNQAGCINPQSNQQQIQMHWILRIFNSNRVGIEIRRRVEIY
ncbi:Hypothetical_protein [Hexamita inflata]|uniref:Hypothetical_protein n=1 Tax=Hexamita inflata TaxID=28002 RepID=A0ABP1HF00_9EUKA